MQTNIEQKKRKFINYAVFWQEIYENPYNLMPKIERVGGCTICTVLSLSLCSLFQSLYYAVP